MKISVLDTICGSGKTTAFIKYINNLPKDKKILYITPFLTEIERIQKECIDKDFKSPRNIGSKSYDIKRLISYGSNIISTHSLFRKFDLELIDLALLNDYVLIMDEVADIIDIVDISEYDMNTLLEKYVIPDDDGKLIWIEDNYEGEFEQYKKMCELNTLYLYGSNNSKYMLWIFPIDIFNAFKKIFIATYMFDAQLQSYYYKYNNVEYDYVYLDCNGNISATYNPTDENEYKKLIKIFEDEKMNRIGDLETSLSKSWFIRNSNNKCIETLKNNCYNFFRNITKSKTEKNMWTTFKSNRNYVKGKGYSKGFIPLNTRATNIYNERNAVAYLCNRYLNPLIKNFFITKNIPVDEERYALSEMLQFIFRSSVRNGKKIDIYIPSSRMRRILKSWINS